MKQNQEKNAQMIRKCQMNYNEVFTTNAVAVVTGITGFAEALVCFTARFVGPILTNRSWNITMR